MNKTLLIVVKLPFNISKNLILDEGIMLLTSLKTRYIIFYNVTMVVEWTHSSYTSKYRSATVPV